jgi:hypothetical protein
MTRLPRKKPATKGAMAVSSRSRASSARGRASPTAPNDAAVAALAIDLGKMIEAARQHVAVAMNAALTTLYWELGQRVRTAVLDGRRAEYGA